MSDNSGKKTSPFMEFKDAWEDTVYGWPRGSKDGQLTDGEKLCLIRLMRYADSKTYEVFPSAGTVAKACGFSDRRVAQRAFSKGEEFGLMRVKVRGRQTATGMNQPSIRVLSLPKTGEQPDTSVPPGITTGEQPDTNLCLTVHPNSPLTPQKNSPTSADFFNTEELAMFAPSGGQQQ